MVATISRDELREKITRGDDFVLAEVLPEDSYRKGHLPGARHLPGEHLADLAPKLLPDKNKEIVVYCGSAL